MQFPMKILDVGHKLRHMLPQISSPSIPKQDSHFPRQHVSGDIQNPNRNTSSKITIKLPRKPVRPECLYRKQIYSSLRKQNPTLSSNDVIKLCHDQYRRLASESQQPYLQMAEADRSRYLGHLAHLRVPLKPTNAINFYIKHNHRQVQAENPGMTFRELMGIVHERWRSLPSDERHRYAEMERQDRIRYYSEVERAPRHVQDSVAARSKQKRQCRLAQLLVQSELNLTPTEYTPLIKQRLGQKYGKPMLPNPPYFTYLTEQLKQAHVATVTDQNQSLKSKLRSNLFTRRASHRWKSLSVTERKRYKDLHEQQMIAYRVALSAWREKMSENGHNVISELLMIRSKQSGYRKRQSQINQDSARKRILEMLRKTAKNNRAQ